MLGSREDALGLRWRVVPPVFSRFHAAFTQGSEPDSLLLALHSRLDVFFPITAANCPRVTQASFQLRRSSLQLKEQGSCVVPELGIEFKGTSGLGTGQCWGILVVTTSLSLL